MGKDVDILATYRRNLEELSPADLELLIQVLTRLIAEGVISHTFKYADMLDIVLAKGEYSSTTTDQIAYNRLMDLEK